jgi:ParB-like chromosome segregation protein Spo0J
VSEVRGEIIMVPTGLIAPNAWNPNRMSQAMMAKELLSIETHGFIVPVTVRELVDSFELLDGEHRWKCARHLGISPIPCWNLGEVEEDDAKQLTIILNETKGDYDAERMRRLVQDLAQRRSPEDLGRILPFSAERMAAMTGQRAEIFDKLSERLQNRSKADTVERVYRIHKDDAETLDEALEKAVHDGAHGQGEAMGWLARAYLDQVEGS